jgi:holo-[acyl-carrier protein] synthase
VILYTTQQRFLQDNFSSVAEENDLLYSLNQKETAGHSVMLGSVGIDLVDVTRIAKLLSRHGNRFLARVLGPDELSHLHTRYDRAQFVAGRFAAKEAAIKALGKYLAERPSLTKIQIVNDSTGRPSLDLTLLSSPHLRAVSAQLSISHERSHAIAIVILTEEP